MWRTCIISTGCQTVHLHVSYLKVILYSNFPLPDKAKAFEKVYFSNAIMSSVEFSFNIILPLWRAVEFLE